MPPAAGHNDGLAHGREADDLRQPVEGATSLLILMPVFNDWIAARKLLDGLDAALAEQGLDACILVVDDGSTVDNNEAEWRASFRALHRIDILRLRRNVGHQRAIAIGLAYVEEHMRCAAVVVIDSDGEDDPRDVPRLYRRCRELSGRPIVFAERTIRSESFTFRVFYRLYKAVHFVLTSRRVRVGNFSVIPAARLASLVAVSELWSHYAAAGTVVLRPARMQRYVSRAVERVALGGYVLVSRTTRTRPGWAWFFDELGRSHTEEIAGETADHLLLRYRYRGTASPAAGGPAPPSLAPGMVDQAQASPGAFSERSAPSPRVATLDRGSSRLSRACGCDSSPLA
jgi:glycosyltransferase involved in cell wall biosynthesis